MTPFDVKVSLSGGFGMIRFGIPAAIHGFGTLVGTGAGVVVDPGVGIPLGKSVY